MPISNLSILRYEINNILITKFVFENNVIIAPATTRIVLPYNDLSLSIQDLIEWQNLILATKNIIDIGSPPQKNIKEEWSYDINKKILVSQLTIGNIEITDSYNFNTSLHTANAREELTFLLPEFLYYVSTREKMISRINGKWI